MSNSYSAPLKRLACKFQSTFDDIFFGTIFAQILNDQLKFLMPNVTYFSLLPRVTSGYFKFPWNFEVSKSFLQSIK